MEIIGIASIRERIELQEKSLVNMVLKVIFSIYQIPLAPV
jgi:hypothetical protein